MASLRLDAVGKWFGRVLAVKEVTLEVTEGEFVTLLGPSGCGKTTTLNIIAGLETPSSGKVYIDGRDVTSLPPARRNVAMVFQDYALYPHMTVRENLSFALRLQKLPREQVESKVVEVSAMLGLQDLLSRKPRELSGGQRQRVALGRAIVRRPRLFLLDEPLSNLDAALRVQMRADLKVLFKQLKVTVVYVTHDQVEAMTLSDRIVIFREGLVQQVGSSAEVYYRPANQFVGTFVGSPPMNLLRGSLNEENGQLVFNAPSVRVRVPAVSGAGRGRDVTLGIRPEDVRIVPRGDAPIVGQVRLSEQLGSETLVHCLIGDQAFTLRLPGNQCLPEGRAVGLSVEPDRVYLFGADSGATLAAPELAEVSVSGR